MVREARNAIRIEAKSGRLSQVPIDPTETIYQGDLCMMDITSPGIYATKLTTSTDGANFVGMSDHTNPQYTAGSLTSNYTKAYINIVQIALVSLIAGANETLHAFDTVEMVTDAQSVRKTATAGNVVAIVDPAWAGQAKAVVIGDEVLGWLKVPAKFAVWQGRA